jgi:hypothetical protein
MTAALAIIADDKNGCGAPAIVPPTRSSVGRLIASYDEVIDAFRARADELELSRLEIDRLSGLADGHSSHLLAKKYTQRLGPVSLLLMLDTLGLRLLVVEDPVLTARTIKLRTPRCQSHLRVTRKLPAPPQDAPPPALTVVHGEQKRGSKYG